VHAAPQWAAADGRPRWQVADVFRLYGDDYRNRHPLPAAHRKVMHAIEVCRTEALGGHLERCDSCGFERSLFHSCRNRHCPRCGSSATNEWVEAQKSELLPVGHFHLVFTVPHELNPLILTNKKVLFNILFKAVSETLADFGRTHLKGKIGFLAVLHTWDQTLRDHFHLHCLIPGGALAFDRSRWIAARSNFLFHVHALSIVFRAKFLDLLQDARSKDQLQFLGRAETLAATSGWNQLHDPLKRKKWVVYAKRPFSSPETVLEYLGRYTHRVAISNHRIQAVAHGKVTFLYRGRKADTARCSMTLDASEFIRRFLLHVLPDGFQRVRHFGLLANRWKKVQLERCFQLLQISPARTEPPSTDPTALPTCPVCHSGLMIAVQTLPPAFLDSS
jgi:Putative transposase/Transposase zinc-binding domain